ncbi:MAG: hypothetical protein JW820_05220 [Spirochaetales bacterium]|nr:hypothetical protein [Spirochaetales bacterium]
MKALLFAVMVLLGVEGAWAEEPPAGAEATDAEATDGSFFRFQIDNRYEDWDSIPALVAFPDSHEPESFTRESFGRELEVLPLREARHWRDGGTALGEVKIVRDERGIYLYASTHQAMADDLSLFLYLHPRRDAARGADARGADAPANRLTLELVPQTQRAPGLVVLWEKEAEPVVIGRVASGGFFLEAEIRAEALLPYLERAPELSYFDLTTCYFDRSSLSYEEFYFASPSFAEVPTPNALF